MNRKQRRQSGNTEKVKTYTMTDVQIEQIKREAAHVAYERLKRDCTNEAFKLMLSIPCLVLRDHFGFGKIRLERFINPCLMWCHSFHDGEITMDELMQVLKEEANVEIV